MANRISDSLHYHSSSTDEETSMELSVKMKEWAKNVSKRPLKFFVAGKGGAGKSALINNLLGLRKEECAKEGFTGEATTRVVQKFVGKKHEVEVIAFDTPGLHDLHIGDKEILSELVKQTGSLCDVFLYCTSLESRVDKSDRAIFSLITRAFSTRPWERTVFVLTFANSERVMMNKDYDQLIKTTESRLCDCLRHEKVAESIIQDAIFCTAGYADPVLQHESCPDWQDRLYLAMMKKADPSIIPAMFQFKWGHRALVIAVECTFISTSYR